MLSYISHKNKRSNKRIKIKKDWCETNPFNILIINKLIIEVPELTK